MLRTLGFIWRYQAIHAANVLINTCQRIPWLGKFVPNRLYRATGKDIFYWIGSLIRLITNLVRKVIYLGLMFGFVNIWLIKYLYPDQPYISNPGLLPPLIIHTFLWLGLFGSAINNPVLLAPRKLTDYELIKIGRVDEKNFYLAQILQHLLHTSLPMLIAAIVLKSFIPLSWLTIIQLMLSHVAIRIIAEAIMLWIYERYRFDYTDYTWLSILLGLIPLGLAYGLPFLLPSVGYAGFITQPLFSLALVGLAGISWLKLIRSDAYVRLVNQKINLSRIMKVTSLAKDARFAGGQVKDRDVALDIPAERLKGKTGYAYLHQLFFERYRRVLNRGMRRRIIGYIGFFIGATVLAYFYKAQIQSRFGALVNSLIQASFYYFYFFGSSGERFTKILFVNMDFHLLPYNFFREPEAVMESLKIRFLKLLQLSFIPTLVLVGLFSLWAYYVTDGLNLREILLLDLVFMILTLFFNLHHLIVYQTFQPYNRNMEIKHPTFRIINFVVYIITFALWRIKNIPTFVYLITLVLMVIYVFVGIHLMKKLAPKNFKMKS